MKRTSYRKGEKHRYAKFTREQVRAIYQDSRTSFEISLDFDFDVTTVAIDSIRSGRTWREATQDLTPGRTNRVRNKNPDPKIIKEVFLAEGMYKDIAKLYGISPSAVSRIKRRASWKEITKNL